MRDRSPETRAGRVFQTAAIGTAARSACMVFVLCLAWEIGQRAHLVPGRYDPYDVVTYAVSVVACWGIDRLIPFVETA